MTSSTVNPHASGSGSTLRAQVQQITWRESLARWIMAGLQSRWTLKHAGKGMWSLLLLLVGWGIIMPVVAADLRDGLILYLPCWFMEITSRVVIFDEKQYKSYYF